MSEAQEVAKRDEARREVAAQFDGASDGIVTFLADMRVAYEIAAMLVQTSFVPQSYQNKPQEAAAAIVTGQGVGLGPMESLRSIDIIQGTPAMRAIALRALVVSKGHELWVEESTAERAVVAGRRAGSDKVQRSVWDMDRAKAMKLTGKDNWLKQAGAMLIARATAECARLVAADVLLGIPYSSEELQDSEPMERAERPARVARPMLTVADRMRAQDVTEPQDAPVVQESVPVAAEEPTAADAVLYDCPVCGQAVSETEGQVCGPCEDAIEADLAAEADRSES